MNFNPASHADLHHPNSTAVQTIVTADLLGLETETTSSSNHPSESRPTSYAFRQFLIDSVPVTPEAVVSSEVRNEATLSTTFLAKSGDGVQRFRPLIPQRPIGFLRPFLSVDEQHSAVTLELENKDNNG